MSNNDPEWIAVNGIFPEKLAGKDLLFQIKKNTYPGKVDESGNFFVNKFGNWEEISWFQIDFYAVIKVAF